MIWLNYGGGVNSTALMVLAVEGKLPYTIGDWQPIFADTKTEKEATYLYIETHAIPYLRAHGKELLTVAPKEGVLERWQRLSVTGSRIIRSCTEEAKINPIKKVIGPDDTLLIGIDAGESHRANREADDNGRRILYPLVELDLDRDDCEAVITRAGLPVPPKSGCWCCPFMRVGEVLDLARNNPCGFEKIVELEAAANEKFPEILRCQWGNTPATKWRERALRGDNSGELFFNEESIPCRCMDG